MILEKGHVAMTTSSDQPQGVSPGFTELLGRALTDADFREALYRDQEAAVRDYRLTEADLVALQKLDRESLEEHARQFAAGGATELTIGIVIRIRF